MRSSEITMDGKPKLLALDHDLNALRDVAAALSPWFDVIRIREPLKVMSLIQADESITAIVTEQVLPQANGVDLLETIRTLRPQVRRVLVSGYGDLGSIIGGLHSGAIQAMVHKPFTRAELIAAVLPNAAQQPAQRRASA